MGGFGSMQHAISSMKANAALRNSKRKQKNKTYQKGNYKEREFDFPKVSETELEKIKADIRAKGKHKRIIEFTIAASLTIVVFVLIFVYLF